MKKQNNKTTFTTSDRPGGTFVALGVALGTHHALASRTRAPRRDPEVSDAWLYTNATHPAIHTTTVEQRATMLSRRRFVVTEHRRQCSSRVRRGREHAL